MKKVIKKLIEGMEKNRCILIEKRIFAENRSKRAYTHGQLNMLLSCMKDLNKIVEESQ